MIKAILSGVICTMLTILFFTYKIESDSFDRAIDLGNQNRIIGEQSAQIANLEYQLNACKILYRGY